MATEDATGQEIHFEHSCGLTSVLLTVVPQHNEGSLALRYNFTACFNCILVQSVHISPGFPDGII